MSERYTVHGTITVRDVGTIVGGAVEIELPPYMNGGLRVLLSAEQARTLRDDLSASIERVEGRQLRRRRTDVPLYLPPLRSGEELRLSYTLAVGPEGAAIVGDVQAEAILEGEGHAGPCAVEEEQG